MDGSNIVAANGEYIAVATGSTTVGASDEALAARATESAARNANARLIAAAPAMLEVLKAIERRMFVAEQEETGNFLGKAILPDIRSIINSIEQEG